MMTTPLIPDGSYRQEKRRALFMYPHVFASDSNELIGYVGDISANGLMLICYQSMATGEQTRIKIKLQQRAKLSAQEMYLDIKVRWVRPYADDLHCIGCSLIDVDEAKLALINEIQTAFGFEPDFSPKRLSLPSIAK